MDTDIVAPERRTRAAVASGASPEFAGVDAVAEVDERRYALSSRYLGGKKFWPHKLSSQADVHSAILSGVHYGSIVFLLSQLKGLEQGDVATAVFGGKEEAERWMGKPAMGLDGQRPIDCSRRSRVPNSSTTS